MTAQPQIENIQGCSPEYLLRNLRAIQSRSHPLYEFLATYLKSRRYLCNPTGNGGYDIRVAGESGEEERSLSLPPLSVFPPPLAARYQAYNPRKHWLLLFGIDALYSDPFRQMALSEFTPIVLIEPDPVVFLAWLIAREFEPIFSLPQMHFFIGERAAETFLQDMDGGLEPYFITCEGFFLIPSSRYMPAGSPLHAFTPAAQKRYAAKMQEIREIGQRFTDFCRNPKRIRTRNVLIVEPAVACWIALGNGLAQGFQECGYRVEERRAAFPPSAMTARDSLEMLVEVQRLRPDYIVCFSHPSDLFVRGIDKAPIPRLIWYVDNPDHLLQKNHGPYDILFPLWNEFRGNLQKRGGRLGEEVPACGVPLAAELRKEYVCEVGFVGTVHDSRPIRSQFPHEIAQKVDAILDAKLQSLKIPFAQLLDDFDLTADDRKRIVQLLKSQYRRPGMSDEQVLYFFLHMESTTLHRVRLLSHLSEFDLKIYGNADWVILLQGTGLEKSYQGCGLDTEQCRHFFRSAAVSLSPHPTYLHGGPNPRDMDILTSGGFPLSDAHRHAGDRMSLFLEPYREIGLFDGVDDVAEKVRYYLDRPDLQKAVVEAGQRRILQDHSYAARARRMAEVADRLM